VPQDLSMLTQLEEINLNGNSFESLEDVIISLTTLPQLKNLHINLHEEE
jgi:Leucine-rich repeat (LRR) protein